MGFTETGFPIFALIMLWNILLLGFGGVSDSAYITDQLPAGISSPQHLNADQVQSQSEEPTAYIAPTTIPEENKPFFGDVFGFIVGTFGFLFKLFFGAAEAMQKSAFPAAIAWVISTFIYVFMTAYIGEWGLDKVSKFQGGR